MPTNDTNGTSPSSNANTPNNNNNTEPHQINDYKRKIPAVGSSSNNANAGPATNPGVSQSPYRRISGPQLSYHNRQTSNKNYYGSSHNTDDYDSAKRSFSGGRGSQKPYYYDSLEQLQLQKQQQQAQKLQKQRSGSLPSMRKNNNNNSAQEQPEKPFLSINTDRDARAANEDPKSALDRPLSSGSIKTPRSAYHSASSYGNPRFSNYGQRKFHGSKYSALGSVEKNGSTPNSASSSNNDVKSFDTNEPADNHSGDSYYPNGTSYPYSKHYKQSGRYFGKSGKPDYYGNSQDSFYGSKYYHGNSNYSSYGAGYGYDHASYGKHPKGHYSSYNNNNNFDDDYGGPGKFNRPKKYNNWYGSSPNPPSTPSNSKTGSASLTSSPCTDDKSIDSKIYNLDTAIKSNDEKRTEEEEHEEDEDEEEDNEDDYEKGNDVDGAKNNGENSLTKTELFHKSIDKSLISSAAAESPKTNYLGIEDRKSGEVSPNNMQKSDTCGVDNEEDGYNIDSDIEIHFDDEEDDDKCEFKKRSSRPETPAVTKEKEVKAEEPLPRNLLTKLNTPESAQIDLKKKRTKATGSAPKRQHHKLYIAFGEGCVFPLNKLEQALFDLKNRPREEIIQEQKYLLKRAVTNFSTNYPFYKNNILINEQVVKPRLVEIFKNTTQRIYYQTLILRKEYSILKEKWDTQTEINEKQLVSIYPDYQSQLFDHKFKNNEPIEDKTTSGRRSRNHIADSVTSEAEFEKILQQIKMNDPLYKAEQHAASIPPMIMNPVDKYSKHFINVNNLVLDKSSFVKRLFTDPIDNFTKEEHALFTEAYVNNPKKFGKVSQLMGGLRTSEECVMHYYNTKRLVNYKQLVANKRNRKTSTRKKTSKSRSNNRKSELHEAIENNVPLPTTDVENEGEEPLKDNDELMIKDSTEENPKRSISDITEHEKKITAEESLEPPTKKQKPDINVAVEVAKPTVTATESAPQVNHVPMQIQSPTQPKEPLLPPSVPIDRFHVSHIKPKSTLPEKNEEIIPFKERKSKPVSSYWSVSEIGLFPGLLQKHGTQWDMIAKEMGSKTTIMVRNYYSKNADKEGWRDTAEHVDKERKEKEKSSASNVMIGNEHGNNAFIQARNQQYDYKHAEPPLGYFVDKIPTGYFNSKNVHSSPVAPRKHEDIWAMKSLAPMPLVTPTIPPVDTSMISSSSKDIQTPNGLLGTFYSNRPLEAPREQKSNIHTLINTASKPAPEVYHKSDISSVLNGVKEAPTDLSIQKSSISSPRVSISSIVNQDLAAARSTSPVLNRPASDSPKTSIANLISPTNNPLSAKASHITPKSSIFNLLNSGSSGEKPLAMPKNHSSQVSQHSTASSRSTTPVNLPPLSSFSNAGANTQQSIYGDKKYASAYDTSRSLLSFASSGSRSILNHSSSPALAGPSNTSSFSSQGTNTWEERRLPALNSVWKPATVHQATQSGFDTLIAAAYRQQEQQQTRSYGDQNARKAGDLSEYHLSNGNGNQAQ